MEMLAHLVTELNGLVNTPLMQAAAPGIMAAAFLLAVLPWMPTNWRPVRVVLITVSIALLGRYLWWRYTATLPPSSEPVNFAAGIIFIFIETVALFSAAISLFFLTGVRNRSREVDEHRDWVRNEPRPPLVDVLICTYDEEERLLERTILGATGLDYPNFRVWVLDDGRRPWLEKLCATLKCGYITRPDNRHAKAGNINHALGKLTEMPDPPQFVAVLDADFVPRANFLNRTMCLFHDPTVGVVQTPQHYINPDPIQTNLGLVGVWPDEQRYFFDIVMPAKDAWGVAFCCGTSSVTRVEALTRLGGVPTDLVTEDYLLSLRLKEIGYTTVYLNEPLTFGLAPEGLKEYVTQRSRWCLEFMQIVRGPSGPFSTKRKIGPIDQLSLFETLLNWSFIYLYKFVGILVPAFYFLLDVRAVQVSLFEMLAIFLPYYAVHSATISWLSQGRVVPIMTDVCQLLTGPAALKSVVQGLVRPHGQKFSVTAKGGDRSTRFIEWPLMRTFLSLLILSVLGVLKAFGLTGEAMPIGTGLLALVWSWYNIAALALLCLICIEQPRRRRSGRFPTDATASVLADGRLHLYKLRDISISGAQFQGHAPAPLGSSLLIRMGRDCLQGTVVRAGSETFAVRFANSLPVRIALVRHIYSAAHEQAVRWVRGAPIARALLKRVLH